MHVEKGGIPENALGRFNTERSSRGVRSSVEERTAKEIGKGNMMSQKPRDQVFKGENGFSCPMLLSDQNSDLWNHQHRGDERF